MPITITYGAGAILRPDEVLGYEWSRAVRNITHQPLASAWPAVTIKPAATRAGVLKLFFLTKAGALAAESAHAAANVFVFADTDHPEVGMRYVVGQGEVKVVQDSDTMRRWLVDVPFQQVAS
jgi:hypothetical protein